MKFLNHNSLFLILYAMCLLGCKNESLEASFENIVTNPKAFDGQLVDVSGLFRRDLGIFLYSGKESANKLELDYAIEIQDKSVDDQLVLGCNEQHVQIKGVILFSNSRAMISNFDSVYSIDSEENCWEK